MPFRNSVLLVVKQNPEISLDSLVSKFESKYANKETAKSAVYRAVKDLEILGFLENNNKTLQITDKGLDSLNSEMKNKLILKLSDLIKRKDIASLDQIISQTHNLIEISKENKDYIEIAKNASNFYISDLDEIEKAIDSRMKELEKLKEIFQEQKQFFKENNFPDFVKLPFNNHTIAKLDKFFRNIRTDKTEKMMFKTGKRFRMRISLYPQQI
jgi:hypothetical protein